MTEPMKAARRAGISAIRHARTVAGSSNNQEDQEAIDKLEASARNTAMDSTDIA